MRAASKIAGTVLTIALLHPAPGSAAGQGPEAEKAFLTRVRRLTFEGRRAGEGYFSPDGKKIVFQSERIPGNPFFQIFELDFETGETRAVSNGVGKTTCAFYQPGTGAILFASTHHDPHAAKLQKEELELRAAGTSRRYAWDFDPEMELYVAEPGADAPRRLTHSRGYDAEGSYSPDGRWIVFSSNRHAYEQSLDEGEQKQLEVDPSVFNEIYLMRSDGTHLRRLTRTPGYDGGPFFTADGSRIVWRRFEENGLIADIWTMKPDGSGVRRITDFGSMSWAPFPDPSGEYFVFTSNKHGFDNFELFIVDTEGTRQPVRVTYTKGFDGLPVVSPDGRRLAWTSTRNGLDNGQIFIADWNHEAALEALRHAPPRAGAGGEEDEK